MHNTKYTCLPAGCRRFPMYTVHPEYPSVHWDPLGANPYPSKSNGYNPVTGFQSPPSVQTCGRLEETLGSSWLLVQPPENGSDNGNLKYTWYRARLRHGRDNANLKFTPQNTATHWQRFSQESSPHRGEDDATDLESLLLTVSLYLLARQNEETSWSIQNTYCTWNASLLRLESWEVWSGFSKDINQRQTDLWFS